MGLPVIPGDASLIKWFICLLALAEEPTLFALLYIGGYYTACRLPTHGGLFTEEILGSRLPSERTEDIEQVCLIFQSSTTGVEVLIGDLPAARVTPFTTYGIDYAGSILTEERSGAK